MLLGALGNGAQSRVGRANGASCRPHTDDEDFGADDLEIDGGLVANARRKEGDTSEENKSDYTETMASAGVPVEDDIEPMPSADSGVMDELLGDEDEELRPW